MNTSNHNVTVADFNSICRFCLKNERRLKPIFKNEPSDDNDESKSIPLNRMITDFSGLVICPDDGFPLLICGKCLNNVHVSHGFRMQCLSSATILEHIKGNVKQPEDTESNDCFDNSGWMDFSDDECKEDICADKLPILPKIETINDLETLKNECTADTTNETNQTEDVNNETVELNSTNLAKHTPTANSKNHRKKKAKRDRLKPGPKPKPKPLPIPKPPKMPKNKKMRKKKVSEICEICGAFVKNLHTHAISHSNINEVYAECDYCHKKFPSKYNLTAHFKIHLNLRKHGCTLCSYKFTQRAHLVRHMLTHTGERPYKCSVCEKTFAQNGTAKMHEKTHFQNREISCPYCSKLFLTKRLLNNHIGIHTGERPFKCSICGVGFVASSSLAIHKRKHKPVNPMNVCEICHMSFEDPIMLRSHKRDHGINEQNRLKIIPMSS